MNATERLIKILYHNLAKKHHPDCQPNNLSKDDANRTLSLISNAYEILCDTGKRRVQDAYLRIDEAGDNDEEDNYDGDSDDDKNSDADNDRNGDGDRPPDKDSTLFPWDWAHVFNFCYCPQLQPLKCTTDGCDKFVHQICQNAFKHRQEHSVTTKQKCCVHHPHSPFTATKPLTSNVEEEQLPGHVSINTSSSELSSSSNLQNHPILQVLLKF
jgi:curved DNA-binding protein CbpA